MQCERTRNNDEYNFNASAGPSVSGLHPFRRRWRAKHGSHAAFASIAHGCVRRTAFRPLWEERRVEHLDRRRRRSKTPCSTFS